MDEFKIYVGDLDDNASNEHLREAFEAFGTVTHVWVSRKPPGFAFVSMQNEIDANDAIRALDGSELCGVRVRVQPAKQQIRQQSRPNQHMPYSNNRMEYRRFTDSRSFEKRRRSPEISYDDLLSQGLAERYRDRSPKRSRHFDRA